MKLENMCRTCLRVPENLLSLLDNKEIIHKIETISSVQINFEDELPITICQECIDNINRSFNFRKVIINSDIELKERYYALSNMKNIDFNEDVIIKEEVIVTENVIIKEDLKVTQLDDVNNIEKSSDNDNKALINSGNEQKIDDVTKKKKNRCCNIHLSIKGASGKVYNCAKCNITCTDSLQWRIHKKSHVSMGVCNVCGKTVRSDNLTKHIKSHTDSPVTCIECGKVFKNSESLRSHMFSHRGETFQCYICGQSYKYRGEYNRHMKRHYDANYGTAKCEICGKILTNKKRMKSHLRTHTGERPYPCGYCKKGFSTRYARNVHLRQHTNEKPFACKYCSEAFPQKVSLVTHVKSKHAKTDVESS